MAGFVLERRRDRMAKLVSAAVLAGLIIPPAVVPTIYVLQESTCSTRCGGCARRGRLPAPFSIILFRLRGDDPPPARRGGDDRRCTGLSLFFRVIFPLLRPVTITVILTASVAIYNDFVNPLYFLPGSDNATCS